MSTRRKKRKVTVGSLKGLKHFKDIRKLLGTLHNRYQHPNRKLHYDEYMSLLMLAFFTPVIDSLRALQEASSLERVQKKLGLKRASLGSLSEAARLFDPTPLAHIFGDLANQLEASDALPRPDRLPDALRLLAVDGTLWTLLPRMSAAFYLDGPKPGRKPGFLAELQLDLLKGVPVDVDVAEGYASEKRLLEAKLMSHCLYLMDRGFVDYTLLQNIIEAQSSFVIRIKEGAVVRVEQEREITSCAEGAGVYEDRIVRVGSEPHAHKLEKPLRMIRASFMTAPAHNLNPKRGKEGGARYGQSRKLDLCLFTDRLDWDAEFIVELYRYRWQVEIFFRWFKHVLGCNHFYSESENGFSLQVYAALIATLLVVLYTGRKPAKALKRALDFYFMGWADEEEFHRLVKAQPQALR